MKRTKQSTFAKRERSEKATGFAPVARTNDNAPILSDCEKDGEKWCNMPLIEKNFFGPQKYVSEIITHPPYITRVNMTRYGYESEHAIYDVVIPERPIQGLSRWYKTNGVSSPYPTATHRRIEIHFNIGIPTYTGQ